MPDCVGAHGNLNEALSNGFSVMASEAYKHMTDDMSLHKHSFVSYSISIVD